MELAPDNLAGIPRGSQLITGHDGPIPSGSTSRPEQIILECLYFYGSTLNHQIKVDFGVWGRVSWKETSLSLSGNSQYDLRIILTVIVRDGLMRIFKTGRK